MAIQIIDNFQVNIASPIDARIVASGSVARDAISYKYEGLRVFDTSNGTAYVWYGGTWSGESSSSITGPGTANYLAKYSTSNTLASSVIFESSGRIGIGTTTFGSPASTLQVNGIVRSVTGGFYGDGSNISNINASNIATGTLTLDRLQVAGSSGWILSRTSTIPNWVNPTTITVGNATNAVNATNATTATNANNVNVTSNSSNSDSNYVLFSNATGNTPILTNTSNSIRINPFTGRVGIGTSTIDAKLHVRQSNNNALILESVASKPNFTVGTYQNNTALIINRYTGSTYTTRRESSWTSYGYPNNYEAITFAGRTYINVLGNGTSDSRAITFGATGSNDQFRMYMTGNSSTVPTVGGAGFYIQNNLCVDGDVAMVSEVVDVNFAKTVSLGSRWVSDFTTGTTGLSSTDTALPSVSYDRIVYVLHTSTGTGGCIMSIQQTGTTYFDVARINDNNGYASCMAIIPAGKQFKIYLQRTSGNAYFSISIYKLGRL